jgi:aminodeoxychorismate lyase
MIAFLNGKFVPEKKATVSVLDRGFLYGDGLFETIRLYHGFPFRWDAHFERLQSGARFLNIAIPCSNSALRQAASRLVTKNKITDALLRIALSRGVGVRGYSPAGANQPVLAMTLHPLPVTGGGARLPKWTLATATFRVPSGDRLANFKTCNKLANVLARAEAESAGADEALLLNTDGEIAEAASSNFFWIEGDRICTPPIGVGILPGVTRAFVFDLCRALDLTVMEKKIRPQGLFRASGAFLTMSSLGIVEVSALDGKILAHSPWVKKLAAQYEREMRRELLT